MRAFRALVVCLVSMALAVGSAGPALSAGPADWPHVGYDGGHSGHNALETTLRPSNVERLRLDWMRRIRPDVGFIYEYMADPYLVREGRVFAAWAGSEAPIKILAAFDERTGERLWTVRSEEWMEPVAASPSTLIVDAGSRGPSTRALDAGTGELLWSRRSARPVVADRAVRHLVAVRRQADDRRVLFIEIVTGDVRWSRRLHVRRWNPSVLLSRRLVVVAVSTDSGPRVVVLRADDGTTVWSQPMRGELSMVAGGRIFTWRWDTRTPGVILEALSLEGGRVMWAFRAPDFARFAAAGGGRVFVDRSRCVENCEGDYGGTYRGGVVALGAASGRVEWRRIGHESHGTVVWNAEALANGLVFVERLRHGRATFGALDSATGRLRWTSTFGPRGVSGSIHVIANGAVFGGLRFGEQGGRIVRLALPPGARRDEGLHRSGGGDS